VKLKLKNAGIDFKEISHSCLALPNASKIDSVIEPDKEAVIQDYNSQRIGDYLKNYKLQTINHKLKFWDCCAGSGGKSIMAYDINPNIELTVSDERESILGNLKKRFEKAGIKKYKTLITDLTSRLPTPNSQFQTIICDAPCTGSGTWSRTPEQLYYFDESKIEEYADLQKKIVSKIIPHLESGGTFIYITCSVFRKENEEVVNFIQKKFSLKLEQMELLKGYDNLPAGKAGKADSMFVALLE
jgi:16S rRNA (cytosine967-C5)-methyltransferase